jgi:hypothetical protein
MYGDIRVHPNLGMPLPKQEILLLAIRIAGSKAQSTRTREHQKQHPEFGMSYIHLA